MFTGGTGTSSRVVDSGSGDGKSYTVAALIQSNYGIRPHLTIGGIPVGKILKGEADLPTDKSKDGSIIVLVVTDAPLTTNQLDRMARHVTVGLSMVGSYGVGRNSSGDIFVALSTAPHGPEVCEDAKKRAIETYSTENVRNESIEPFFYGCAEAVEEAILNSMVASADGTVGMDGTKIEGLPLDKVRELLDRHLVKV